MVIIPKGKQVKKKMHILTHFSRKVYGEKSINLINNKVPLTENLILLYIKKWI